MLKKELRSLYKTKRAALDEEEIEFNSVEIANQLLRMPIWDYVYYHLFMTIETQKEIQTEYILQILFGKDKEVVLSKSDFELGTLTHYLLTENTQLRRNAYDIPEPVDGIEVPESKLDVVFIPLLAFDTKGNRVGYGKGFYDRFLAKCRPETLKIGLSLFEAVPEITDASAEDIRLDYCVTPERVYSFGVETSS
ncbi:MAG: 5-formyltetrahydrofolate cyclo-ligase [Flavobacterium sp.]|uniref:5-formyltetrahydrofolate cyclo-ligase n=1 Tax=Flavobacterium sp. TaxID=239 RepID=UPI0022C8B819|nr:5-formyltetrahydrofolate cyclo-ligase [Flavobacterium sp.]MCZ8169266.1 5-formyltetrahydrofolate cyclo-ligase [Flavobacterium sp.]MCZ8297380.1 5-formyltetrahydrofolate cyclo-ligase [Flavobacterium sp.]